MCIYRRNRESTLRTNSRTREGIDIFRERRLHLNAVEGDARDLTCIGDADPYQLRGLLNLRSVAPIQPKIKNLDLRRHRRPIEVNNFFQCAAGGYRSPRV